MSTYILTSMFANGFSGNIAELLNQKITKRNKFAFVASEFEMIHAKTDGYCSFFLNMFEAIGIRFDEICTVDGRMTVEEAKRTVAEADVVWLSGGNTPIQFNYLKKYGLDSIIKNHEGVIIGMSAGAINMAETAICTLSCGHHKQEIYSAIGCVNISVEPHFDISKVSDELVELSKRHLIYGLCDESVIVCSDGKFEFIGEIYRLCDGNIEQVN